MREGRRRIELARSARARESSAGAVGWCGELFYICRFCDRGQIYWGQTCRQHGDRAAHARANAFYQASEEGRLDHRDHSATIAIGNANARRTRVPRS
jgi:hypothetical protein